MLRSSPFPPITRIKYRNNLFPLHRGRWTKSDEPPGTRTIPCAYFSHLPAGRHGSKTHSSSSHPITAALQPVPIQPGGSGATMCRSCFICRQTENRRYMRRPLNKPTYCQAYCIFSDVKRLSQPLEGTSLGPTAPGRSTMRTASGH